MGAKDIFDQAAIDIFNGLGEDALFIPNVGDPVACKVDISKEVDLHPGGYEATTWQPDTRLECVLSVIGKEPDAGEQFQVGGITYTVQSFPPENDGRFVKVRVK